MGSIMPRAAHGGRGGVWDMSFMSVRGGVLVSVAYMCGSVAGPVPIPHPGGGFTIATPPRSQIATFPALIK